TPPLPTVTLPLHDALPISEAGGGGDGSCPRRRATVCGCKNEGGCEHGGDQSDQSCQRSRYPPGCQKAQEQDNGQSGEQRGKNRRSEEHTSELQSPDHIVCR